MVVTNQPHLVSLNFIEFVFELWPSDPWWKPSGHILCIYLYHKYIGVHWRVPNDLVVRNYVFGKGVGPAGLGEAGRPAARVQNL